MSFASIPEEPPDPVFGLAALCQTDPRENKIDLLVGIYQDTPGHPYIFSSVQKAKQAILREDLLANYLPIDGFAPFRDEMEKWILRHLLEITRPHMASLQAVGGTGALRLGGELLFQWLSPQIAIPSTTWVNHKNIFAQSHLQILSYPYILSPTLQEDLLLDALEKLPNNIAILFHASSHNPSGVDPSRALWEEILTICQRKNCLPFFDSAYHGLGKGEEEDLFPLYLALEKGMDALLSYSCSKNFGLYSQRTALFALFSKTPKMALSQTKKIIRSLYSNPPAHGARIVHHILSTPSLRAEWQQELSSIRSHLQETRRLLASSLSAVCPSWDLTALQEGSGMLTYLPLSKEQVVHLRNKYGIYLLDSGRINLTGLSSQNLPYLLEALQTL